MSSTSMIVCREFKKADEIRDAGLSTPENVRRFDDIQYGPDPKWNVLDVYRPRNSDAVLPVIVSVHGGGWVYGDKERYQYYCMSLVQHGFAVINYTYRLAPKYKYPAALEDTALVFFWAKDHSNEYSFDVNRIFAVGDSAGAHLLGLYACLCTDREFASGYPFSAAETVCPEAVALNCGIYRFEKNRKKDLTTELMKDFLPNRGTEAELREISVSEHLTERFPPAFVMTAEGDFLAEQALPFVEELKRLGVRAEYHYYGDSEHVLGHVFHCDIRQAEAQRCNREECEFFSQFFSK